MPNPRRLTHSRGTSWEITYRVDGRMVRQRFETRALAVNALARARAPALDGLGITPADGKTTLAEYAPRWLAAQQCRPSTLAMYDSHVRNHLVPMLGRRPMGSLRRSDISAFVVDLTRKQLATATVVTIYRPRALGRAAVPGGAGRAAGDHRRAQDRGQPPRPAAPPVRRHRPGPAHRAVRPGS
jgi:hypothetical protein